MSKLSLLDIFSYLHSVMVANPCRLRTSTDVNYFSTAYAHSSLARHDDWICKAILSVPLRYALWVASLRKR
jgi:hypothetical protein